DGGPPGPGLGEAEAVVSFDVVWNGPVTRRVTVRDAANGFAGFFLEDQATINWSGSNELGFRFRANPGSFATSVPEGAPFAELGVEVNGRFFPSGASPRLAATPPGPGADAARDLVFALLAPQGGSEAVPPAPAFPAGTGPMPQAQASDGGAGPGRP